MKYLYLVLDLGSILVPLIFSFHPRLLFWKQWRAALPALFITAFGFVVWDIAYTEMGVWGFNPTYLCGFYIMNLPIEEVLFFICIPYSCLFTYHCLKLLVQEHFCLKFEQLITPSLVFVMLAVGISNLGLLYTVAAFTATGVLLVLLRYLLKVQWLGNFYFAWLVLLVPFFVVNGILTGTGLDAPVVWYNDGENLGLRLLTIPVEDFFYGMLLILINTALFELFSKQQKTAA